MINKKRLVNILIVSSIICYIVVVGLLINSVHNFFDVPEFISKQIERLVKYARDHLMWKGVDLHSMKNLNDSTASVMFIFLIYSALNISHIVLAPVVDVYEYIMPLFTVLFMPLSWIVSFSIFSCISKCTIFWFIPRMFRKIFIPLWKFNLGLLNTYLPKLIDYLEEWVIFIIDVINHPKQYIMILCSPQTWVNLINDAIDTFFYMFTVYSPALLICLVYPLFLIMISIFFILSANTLVLRTSLTNNKNFVVSLFNKWYKNSSFIYLLITCNTIFFVKAIYHSYFIKFYFFEVIDSTKYLWFPNYLTVDKYTMVCMTIISLLFTLFLYISKNELQKVVKPELVFMLVLSVSILLLLSQVSDLLLIYIGIILLSLTLYPLIALDKKSSGNTEAAAKYFFMGGVSNSIMIYGVSLIYREFNSLNYYEISNIFSTQINPSTSYSMLIGFLFITFGFLFKLSIVPLQNWTPDVYLGSPTLVTCFMATIVKFGVYCSFVRFYYSILSEYIAHSSFEITKLLLTFSVSSIIIGSIGAVDQFKIKRFIGFTTINQMGFILLGLALKNMYGFVASYVYMFIYVVLNLIFFYFLLNTKFAVSGGKSITYLSDLSNLFKYNRFAGATFILLLFSLAGMPPTIGFYMKLLTIKALVISGYFKLAVFILYINILSIYYYFRIVKIIFFDTESLIFDSKYEIHLNTKDAREKHTNDLNSPVFDFSGITLPYDILMGRTLGKYLSNTVSNLLFYIPVWLFLSGVGLYWVDLFKVSYMLLNMWNNINFINEYNEQYKLFEIYSFLKIF